MDSNTFALTVVALAVATWIVYKVRGAVGGIECTHNQVHENGEKIDHLAFMLATMMDALKIAHPEDDDEVPNAPNLENLVAEWDNEN